LGFALRRGRPARVGLDVNPDIMPGNAVA